MWSTPQGYVTLWNSTKEMWGQFGFVLPSPMLVWSTPLGLPEWWGGRMHQHSTSGIRKRRWHSYMLTHDTMRGCGWTSWVVCINDKFSDIRERNVTIRSEIWATNIRSLGCHDIWECVTLRGLILRGLGCTPSLPASTRYMASAPQCPGRFLGSLSKS